MKLDSEEFWEDVVKWSLAAFLVTFLLLLVLLFVLA